MLARFGERRDKEVAGTEGGTEATIDEDAKRGDGDGEAVIGWILSAADVKEDIEGGGDGGVVRGGVDEGVYELRKRVEERGGA